MSKTLEGFNAKKKKKRYPNAELEYEKIDLIPHQGRSN